jgi:hypothetical protein
MLVVQHASIMTFSSLSKAFRTGLQTGQVCQFLCVTSLGEENAIRSRIKGYITTKIETVMRAHRASKYRSNGRHQQF